MKFEIVAVGSMNTRGLGDALDEYVERIQRYVPAVVREVSSGNSSRQGERKRQEADALRGAASEDGVWVALDAAGKTVSSPKMAEWIDGQMVSGVRYVTFFIGGAYGLDPEFRRQECNWSLSLSSMTRAHEMARVMLAEQLYRSMTIIRGEPYHK
jgi:23S rRNA (pseudouridine1915-N3)-methyltransferase